MLRSGCARDWVTMDHFETARAGAPMGRPCRPRRWVLNGTIAALAMLAGQEGPSAQGCSSAWEPFPPGAFDGRVHALLQTGTVQNPTLYAAGEFTQAGGRAARNLAVFRNGAWTEVGGGLDGPGFALAQLGTRIYVGGRFGRAGTSSVSNVAAFDGANWDALDGGTDGEVRVLEPHTLGLSGPGMLVGGAFGRAGVTPVDGLAWRGGSWVRFGPPGRREVAAIASVSTGLGNELWIGGAEASGGFVAAFDGAAWRTVGGGLPPITGLADDVGRGTVAVSPFTPTPFRWSGTVWLPIGSVAIGAHTVLVDGGQLYVGSWNGLFRLTAGSFVEVGAVNGDIRSLVRDGGSIWLGGMFTSIGTSEVTCVARYDGNGFSPVANASAGVGAYGNVSAIHSADVDGDGIDELYVAGVFHHVGPLRAPHIARWDGTRWAALGESLRIGSFPSSMLDWQGQLYVVGQINGSVSIDSPNVIRWDGVQWTAVGGGLSSPASGLCIHDEGPGPALFACGQFGVAKWTGSVWQYRGQQALSSGRGNVNTLASFAGALYAGGVFDSIAGVPAQNLAAWSNGAWHDVGGGVRRGAIGVDSMLVHRHRLYVGGNFDLAGSSTVANIVSWGGSPTPFWSSLGSGVDSWVLDLKVVDDELVAAGVLSRAGSQGVETFATWDGGRWSQFGGAGVRALVGALSVFDPDGGGTSPREVIAGGIIEDIAGHPTGNLARYRGPPSPWTSLGGGVPRLFNSLPFGRAGLAGSGPLTNGSPVSLDLVRAAANSPSALVISQQSNPIELFGGTWFANPMEITLPFTTDANGRWQGNLVWPLLPCASEIFFQAAFLDPTLATGLAFSDGLRAVSR